MSPQFCLDSSMKMVSRKASQHWFQVHLEELEQVLVLHVDEVKDRFEMFRDLLWVLENDKFIRVSSLNHVANGKENELWNVLQSMLGRVFQHLFAVAFANLRIKHEENCSMVSPKTIGWQPPVEGFLPKSCSIDFRKHMLTCTDPISQSATTEQTPVFREVGTLHALGTTTRSTVPLITCVGAWSKRMQKHWTSCRSIASSASNSLLLSQPALRLFQRFERSSVT